MATGMSQGGGGGGSGWEMPTMKMTWRRMGKEEKAMCVVTLLCAMCCFVTCVFNDIPNSLTTCLKWRSQCANSTTTFYYHTTFLCLPCLLPNPTTLPLPTSGATCEREGRKERPWEEKTYVAEKRRLSGGWEEKEGEGEVNYDPLCLMQFQPSLYTILYS